MSTSRQMWANFVSHLNKVQRLDRISKEGHKNFLGSIASYEKIFMEANPPKLMSLDDLMADNIIDNNFRDGYFRPEAGSTIFYRANGIETGVGCFDVKYQEQSGFDIESATVWLANGSFIGVGPKDEVFEVES